MNRMHIAITTAILTTSMAGGVALAGEKADKESAAGQQTMQSGQQGENPGAGSADANAAAQAGAGGAAGQDTNVASSAETRDWAQVDANSDNLISPDEMEAALQERGPQAGQQR